MGDGWLDELVAMNREWEKRDWMMRARLQVSALVEARRRNEKRRWA